MAPRAWAIQKISLLNYIFANKAASSQPQGNGRREYVGCTQPCDVDPKIRNIVYFKDITSTRNVRHESKLPNSLYFLDRITAPKLVDNRQCFKPLPVFLIAWIDPFWTTMRWFLVVLETAATPSEMVACSYNQNLRIRYGQLHCLSVKEELAVAYLPTYHRRRNEYVKIQEKSYAGNSHRNAAWLGTAKYIKINN
jgi:hypothetical protein